MRLLIFSLCFLATPAVSNPFAETPVDWAGSGAYRPALDAEFEQMRCRGSTIPTESGFSFKGRCASPAAVATMELEATLSGSDAQMVLSASILDRPLMLTGAQGQNGIVGESTAPITIGGVPVRFRLQINFDGSDRFILTEFATPLEGGDRSMLAQIQFAR